MYRNMHLLGKVISSVTHDVLRDQSSAVSLKVCAVFKVHVPYITLECSLFFKERFNGSRHSYFKRNRTFITSETSNQGVEISLRQYTERRNYLQEVTLL